MRNRVYERDINKCLETHLRDMCVCVAEMQKSHAICESQCLQWLSINIMKHYLSLTRGSSPTPTAYSVCIHCAICIIREAVYY